MPRHAVHVLTEGSVAAGFLLWRQRSTHVTVAAKVTYGFSTGQTLVLRAPEPLGSLGGAPPFSGDLAPHRPRCDVTLEGAVHAVGHSTGVHARLAVHAGAAPLIERRLYVAGARDASGVVSAFAAMPLTFDRALGGPHDASNPMGTASPLILDAMRPRRPGCLSAIPPAWPVRSAQLASAELRDDAGVLVLRDPFPWTYFQQAPFEQQIDALPAGAIVTLEHLSSIARRIAFVVPDEAPRVTIDGAPLPMRVDAMAIDADRSTVSFVFRGARPLSADGGSVDVRVAFHSAMAQQATAGIDRAAVDSPIAPFLVAAMRARAVEGLPPSHRETAPIEPSAIGAPIAPFLLAASGRSRGAGDVSATPFAAPPPPKSEGKGDTAAPSAASPSAGASPPRPVAPLVALPMAPTVEPQPAPPRHARPLGDRLRGSGMSDAQVAAVERSLARPPREAPPPDED